MTKTEYHDNGILKSITHTDKKGELHHDSCAAYQEWDENGQERVRAFFQHGNPYNQKGPFHIEWEHNGVEKDEVPYGKNPVYGKEFQPLLNNYKSNTRVNFVKHQTLNSFISDQGFEITRSGDQCVLLRHKQHLAHFPHILSCVKLANTIYNEEQHTYKIEWI